MIEHLRTWASTSLVPDWAPNIHPVVVHFPIALLVTAVGVDTVGWAFRHRSLRRVATVLYVLGAGATIAAYFTGRAAVQTVWLPGVAHAIVKEHGDWALRTVWFFGLATAARLVLLRSSRRDAGPLVAAGLALAGDRKSVV